VYKQLFIFTEGPDDQRFFEGVVKPLFEKKYDHVKVCLYSEEKDEKCKKFLRNIKSMDADYIVAGDIDDSPCITHKKQKVQAKFGNLEEDRIILVIREIESWYLAGIDDQCAKKLRMRSFETTDNLTKETFNEATPRRFDSRVDFMVELLKFFDSEIAKQKNKSFRYFFEKHCC